ncbi:hypothetical protein LTR94_025465 [Friedmanniomyces endolithicus]|nr:hypothetical protein LTR94_025465 [Friedmanniomyces endolithicus]
MTPLFRVQKPDPSLADWVLHHQIIRFRFSTSGEVPIKPYWPRPHSALAFYPRALETLVDATGARLQVKSRTSLIGQPTVLTHRLGGADFCVYQIEFQPGALHRLFGGSMTALTDEALDAEAVFPDLIPVADRIAQAATVQDMVEIAETWLKSRIMSCSAEANAIDWAAQRLISGQARSLDRLARHVGMTPRSLHRAFRERTGVSPKLFGRIARLDRLIRGRNTDPKHDWLSLALEAGYYDYQHMARDFRDLCLSSPSSTR